MRYFKHVSDGYIQYVGTGTGGTEVTDSEYNEILTIIHNKPQGTTATDYRLRENLTWEEYEIPPMPEPEPEADEILDILMGVTE